jgi:CheY-like chemotaxis protein
VNDFSRLDAGAAHLEQVSFSLATLVDELCRHLAARAEKKGLGLRWFVDLDVPVALSGDPKRLRQVLATLLGSAVRFTERGEVRLDVRVESGSDQGIVLRFTVIDSGIGLQPDACAQLFDAFSPAPPVPGRARDGADLGLAIARQVVRLMGGDIHVHSAPGAGTTFWFTARFSAAGVENGLVPAIEASALPPPARPLRILIAEDNPLNQVVLTEQLNQLGHTSVCVENGRDALATLDGTAWDAVLLDCQMPVMDGFQTVAAIRRKEAEAAPGAGRRIWVVAVTAHTLDGERDACIDAGMDDFLSKPFHVQRLAEIIARIPPLPHDTGDLPPASIDVSQLGTLAKSKAASGENLLDRMVNLFTESGPPLLDDMDQALRQDDLPAAMRAVHKLAGGCGYFGAEILFSLCTEFQRLGPMGEQSTVRALAPRIRQEYARVELALQCNRRTKKAEV